MASRLQEKYMKEVAPALMEKFNYKNVMEIPKIDKIVINLGSVIAFKVELACLDEKLLVYDFYKVELVQGIYKLIIPGKKQFVRKCIGAHKSY